VEDQASIGLLLGSRDSSGVLLSPEGVVAGRVSVPNSSTVADGIDGLVGMVAQLLRKARRLQVAVESVGIGFPGVIDPAEGTVRGTRMALRAWRGVALAEMVSQRVGLPVVARNDVVCALLGEAALGSVVGERDVIMAYSSTGVGGAIMLGGQVRLGRRGAVGHLGHIPSEAAAGLRCSCGGVGHLDSIASAAGMTRWYRRQRHLDPSEAPYLRTVTEAAGHGDHLAVEALRTGGTALGMALGGLANLLEPDVIVLAGESANDPIYRAAVVDALNGEIIVGNAAPDLRLAALGGQAQVIGAALAPR
jgi:glucokinase